MMCPNCTAFMQGPTLDRTHEWLWYSCPACPCNKRVRASSADVARFNNVIPFNPRERRARVGA